MVPEDLAQLFRGLERVLDSHRGWDPGSRELASRLARRLGAPCFEHTTSRLVIDVNRSLDRKKLFSEATLQLDEAARQSVIDRFWRPHRERVTGAARELVAGGATVVQIGVHTFAPEFKNRVRRADVGLLYDPSRGLEKAFAHRVHEALKERRRDLRVRRNYPYFGKSDGLVTTLRGELPQDRYLGFELEVNQKFPLAGDTEAWERLQDDLVAAIHAAI